jgi:TRAP-type mannitol/chloroaromatic compound transport system substrate-binding protein
MKRRDFLKTASVGAAAASTAVISGAPSVHASKKITWKMVTTWPPNMLFLQTGVERFAKRVKEMSGGQFRIKVYAGGELVPPFGSFEAVSGGTVEAGSGAAYYWAGKEPAFQWFAAVPFGLNSQGMAAWMFGGDGLKLWEKLGAEFNIVPRPTNTTGVQMGGWFNKKINTIEDFKGLKMRIPGLGGKVIAKAGGTVVLLPGGEIFTSLERGVIDATEWIGPLHDSDMGFQKVAKYYYYPGFHECGTCLDIFFNKKAYDSLPKEFKCILDSGTCLDIFFNKKAYDSLPKEFKCILDVAATDNYIWSLAGFDAGNGACLQKMIDKYKVKLKRYPKEVIDGLRALSDEVVAEEAAKSAWATKVNDNFQKFKKQVGMWYNISEKSYYDLILDNYKLGG